MGLSANSFRTLKEIVRPYCRWLYLSMFPKQRASYFRASWRDEPARLDPSAIDIPSASMQPDVLFLPMNDWHTRIQRSQQLAKAFAAMGSRCFYLNPHLGCEYPAPYLMDPHSRISTIAPRVLELHVHVPREHVFHSRRLSSKENGRVSNTLQTVAAIAGIQNAFQIVSFPIWGEVARQLRASLGFPVIYDCHDLLGGFRNIAPEIVADETDLLEQADAVIFSSEWLMTKVLDSFPAVAGKSHLVRNGVDADQFAAASRHSNFTSRRSKVIGYVGALDYWFDVDTISRAASAHPEWLFKLAGRVEDKRVWTLRKHPNVEFAGEIPYEDVPAYMASFDVGIIPFLRNDLTRATNPIKLYEYFSFGLPVVSTDLPEVDLYCETAYCASDAGEFLAQLEKAVVENDPPVRRRRIAIARAESWNDRACRVLQSLPAPSGLERTSKSADTAWREAG